jgi:uncharacterized protein (TIGR02996 family)
MDLLSQHEAFLRNIFDAPDDDTPRLVYADFLQENGDEERANIIRWQCGLGRRPGDLLPVQEGYTRGFAAPWKTTILTLDQLRDVESFRRQIIQSHPECFAVAGVKLSGGRITSAEPFDALFALAMFTRVTELNLAGDEIDEEDAGESMLKTFRLEPVITTAGVEALSRHRGVRRITSLILTNNNLDNDAARALVKSPYLDNLKRLDLLHGNRLRGRVWQQVIERFGEDVVG